MWLASSDQPYLVAISALSADFNYAHVRVLIYAKCTIAARGLCPIVWLEARYPLDLRAPELILVRSVNKTLDVCSFGCFVLELITGLSLF